MDKLSELVQDLNLTGCRIGRLRFERKIGHSQFPVWKGTEELSTSIPRTVAIKVLALATDGRNKDVLEKLFQSEVDALKHLSGHKAIIQFYGLHPEVMFVDVDNKYPYENEAAALAEGVSKSDLVRTSLRFLILEFVEDGPSGDLAYLEYAKKNPHKACEHLADVADGLKKILETQGHRDVKPANILWSKKDDALKIIDLGLAKPVAATGTRSSISGTPQYLAPEEYDNNTYSAEARDVYAFSIAAYQILAGGKLPLEEPSQPKDRVLRWQKAHKNPDRPDLKWTCPWMTWELNSLLRLGMSADPASRPKMGELRDAFRHESHWILSRSKPTSARETAVVDLPFSLNLIEPQVQYDDSGLIVNPKFRVDGLNQHCYWVELQIERKGPDKVARLHQLLKSNIGPYYHMHLTYGEWGFAISFWSRADKALTGLWQGLSALADKTRIMRCSNCVVIDKNGNESPEFRKGTKSVQQRLIFDNLRDLYLMQFVDSKYGKPLSDRKVVLPWSPKRNKVYGISYLMPEVRQLNDGFAKKAQKLLLPDIIETVKKTSGIQGAVYYRRSSDELPILPERVESSNAVGALVYMCSSFEDAYRVPQTILQSDDYRPDTRLFTGWYSVWHDGVTWDELVDAPYDGSPSRYFTPTVSHS